MSFSLHKVIFICVDTVEHLSNSKKIYQHTCYSIKQIIYSMKIKIDIFVALKSICYKIWRIGNLSQNSRLKKNLQRIRRGNMLNIINNFSSVKAGRVALLWVPIVM